MEPTPVLATPPGSDDIALLAERFPACFDLKRRRPLKIRIYQDLIALQEELGGIDLKQATKRYCTHPRYRKPLKEGAIRIELQGEPAGVVTAEEAENARARLEMTNARREGWLLRQRGHDRVPLPTLHDAGFNPGNCSGFWFTEQSTWRLWLSNGFFPPRGVSRYHVALKL